MGFGKLLQTVCKNLRQSDYCSGFEKPVHAASSCFQNHFMAAIVAYDFLFNQQDLSLKTPAAFSKICIISKLFHRNGFKKMF
jgi:hypothetical protein